MIVAPAMQTRLGSVDALRGLTVLAMLLVNNPGDWGHVFAPLEHAAWHGCTPTDLIFPFFLFVMGVSISLSLASQAGGSVAISLQQRVVVLRSLRLVALGLIINLAALWALDPAALRICGVLQRLGICYLAAASVALHTRARTQWWLFGGLLAGYWLLLLAGGSLAPGTNLVSRVDTLVFGRHLYEFDAASGHGHDPEGLLSTLPAIATTLLGVRAGSWLRSGALRRITAAGLLALVLGTAWATVLPFNKNLWTPSYVLWSGGWALLALATASALIDRRAWPPLGRSPGRNAIVIYAGSQLLLLLLIGIGWLEPIYASGLASWITPRFGPYVASLAFALAFVAFWWLIAWWLDRRRWYVTI